MLLVMLGFGNGLEHGVQRNMAGFITRSLFIWGQQTSKAYRGHPAHRGVQLRNADSDALLGRVQGIEALGPRMQLGGWMEGNNVSAGARTGNFNVMGDVPAYARIEGITPSSGRFINVRDMAERRKVTVIGSEAARVLFGSTLVVGEWLRIQGVPFQVIGVVDSELPGDEGERAKNTLHVPLATFQLAFNMPDKVGWYALLVAPDQDAAVVEQAALATLRSRHEVDPTDEQALGSYNGARGYDKLGTLFRSLRFFVWFVSIATLLAGALGVSNVLLISVKQRTREIGIKKAIGATPWTIVSTILQEALVLTLTSGYLGLAAGVAAIEWADRVLTLPGSPLSRPSVELEAALGAALLLIAIGALAAVVPALHAARIRPAVALRAD
jgi:putative ABC transport system permease protein